MAKTTRFMLAFLFAFIFVMGMGSASDMSISFVSPQNISHDVGTFTLNFILSNSNNTYNAEHINLSGSISSISGASVSNFVFSPAGNLITNNSNKSVSATVSLPKHNSGSFIILISGNASINGTSNPISGQTTIQILDEYKLNVGSVVVSDDKNTTLIKIENVGNQPLSGQLSFPSERNGIKISSSNANFGILNPGQSTNVNFDLEIPSSNIVGSTIFNLVVETSQGNFSGTLAVEKTFCRTGEQGDEISIRDVRDRSSGSDFEWEPLKDIRLRVEVDNNADTSSSVTVVIGLYDTTRNRFTDLTELDRELEETIRISSGSWERYDFEFTLPADLDINSDYRLYVKAFVRNQESAQCTSDISGGNNIFFEPVFIDFDDEVIADQWDTPQIFQCGDTNTISFRVHNLDLGDDEIMRINLRSANLNLNVYSNDFELDRGDREIVFIDFPIPTDVTSGSYRLDIYAEYDYLERTDSFRERTLLRSELIRVEGDKCKPAFTPTISASLDADTETLVGEELRVKITVTNPADAETTTYIIALDDTTWASSAVLDQSSFSLAPGESKTITATFNPTQAGNQEFTVKAIYGTRVHEQKVSISIDEKTNFFSRISNSLGLEGNATFWLTIAIFVVLILIIVVLLVKFINSSKSE